MKPRNRLDKSTDDLKIHVLLIASWALGTGWWTADKDVTLANSLLA